MKTFLVFDANNALLEMREQETAPAGDELQSTAATVVEFIPVDGDTDVQNYALVDGALTHNPPAVE